MNVLNALIAKVVCGNKQAALFLHTITMIAHVWDDLIDRDKQVRDEQINGVFWHALVELPRNEFYCEHFSSLHPLMAKAIIDWEVATKMEREGGDPEVSYILRSSFVDMYTMTALLCGGRDFALEIGAEIRFATHHEGLQKYTEALDTERNAREGVRKCV